MVHQQRITSPGQTYALEVPGNAEPDMVSMKITNRGDRTLTDVRVNTDKQFGDFHSLDTILESAGVTKAEPTVENLKKLLRFYVQSRSLGRTALGKAIVDDPVPHANIWEVNQPYLVVGGCLKGSFRRRLPEDWLKVYVT